jgi:Arc/MetJ-type ribon-helix-helix transcriptional regulator
MARCYDKSMKYQSAKIAITMDPELLFKIDALVKNKRFKNRSQAIQIAVRQAVERLEHDKLKQECLKLDAKAEQDIAEEGLAKDLDEWPEY